MTSTDHRSSQLDLDAIEARATSEHLTPGPWKLDYEQCDCSDGYCHHGAYVAAVTAPTPTEIAAERLKGTDEKPRDYDFCRTEMGDFSSADWELMAHARTDVPALVDEVRRLRAIEAVAIEVRAKHKPRTERHGSGCVQCGIVWPCPTYKALNDAARPAVRPAVETGDDETFCSWGDGDAPGSGCILPAGHEPANRHLYTPGDGEFDE